ncbi:MAG: Crp/Fnr family transcriptional regulator [Kangiellaceae bacterium]|jgi:CRP/FNR family cyclic AMP-dependent transcriptional regulator|nr:Crp/Fnr family transcriptional regulator [Kangiellaceae bacterium]|tara:strand:+ start:3985 stop:4638 length:654 start_codon:yes stop_codon:yes gene_type:complete
MQELLKKVCIFSGLDDQALASIEQKMVRRKVPKNTVIVYEGDNADSMYIIESGSVNVFVADDEGRELVLTQQGEGSYFGELAILANEQRSASVITTQPSTFLVINKDNFRQVIEENVAIAMVLLENLAQLSRRQVNSIKSFAMKDVYGRLVQVLEDAAVEEDERLLVRPKLTQQALANRVGATRERVAKIMKDLVNGGYLEVTSSAIEIKKRLPSSY